MIKESKYCSDVTKKYFKRELVMIKKAMKLLKTLLNFEFVENDFIDNDVKLRDYCQITGKYRGFTHRDFNINLKLNHKVMILILLCKNYAN